MENEPQMGSTEPKNEVIEPQEETPAEPKAEEMKPAAEEQPKQPEKQKKPLSPTAIIALVLAIIALIVGIVIIMNLAKVRRNVQERREDVSERIQDIKDKAQEEKAEEETAPAEEADEEAEAAEPEEEETVTSSESDPISYEVSPAFVTVVARERTGSEIFDAEDLEARADECGKLYMEGYHQDIYDDFADETVIEYTFRYRGESQKPDVYVITVVPNVRGYETMDQFNSDFGLCSDAGKYYPRNLNEDWLTFESSCGSGYDDGSGLPHGCQEIKDQIGDTVYLK